MKIRSLSLTNFRLFKRLEIEFDDHLNLFIGDNSEGKTTILEAIHFLSLLTSPLATNDREVVNFLCLEEAVPVARIKATIEKKGKVHRLEMRLILNPSGNDSFRMRKELRIDGVQRRLYDSAGFFNSVLFMPQMTRIIESGPDERRRYLDQVLSQSQPGYMRALGNYIKGVSRRNSLLKQLAEKGGDMNQLTFWDELLADKGSQIMYERIRALRELNILANEHHRRLTSGNESLKINYKPSLAFSSHTIPKESTIVEDTAEIKAQFLSQLLTKRREEVARGITTIGPHRDDLQFMVNGVDVHVYGSRGQIRTVVMAIKLAEKDLFRERWGELPVFLLDETLAELDKKRRSDLLESLKNGGQAILTTADLDLFDKDFIRHCEVWRVVQGGITKAVF